MNERRKLRELTAQIKKEFTSQELFWYKIPDMYGGNKRPFDVIGVYRNVPFAIEFKDSGGKLTSEQKQNLEDFYLCSGGRAYVGEFQNRSIRFITIGGQEHTVNKQGKEYLALFLLLQWLITKH